VEELKEDYPGGFLMRGEDMGPPILGESCPDELGMDKETRNWSERGEERGTKHKVL